MISSAVATGAWSIAGDLPGGAASWYGQHDGPVALDDTGGLLVAGGADANSGPLGRAAVYDPNGKAWKPTGGLGAPRRLHSLTRLADGRVLAAGGLGGPGSAGPGLSSAERYDKGSGNWSPTAALSTGARWGHSAVLLPGGSVLVAGGTRLRPGTTTTMALRSVELYNPTDGGSWTQVADMTDARTGHTAVLLDNGTVLVVGGAAPVGTAEDPALAFCELYNPKTDTWTPTGSLRHARRYHQATLLSPTTVLVTGGTAPGASGEGPFDPFSQRTAEVYDQATGVWKSVTDMPSGRAFHRAVPLGTGSVLVLGGTASDRDEAGYRSAVRYDVAGDAWTPIVGMPTGRWSFAAAALPNDQVVVAGGVTRSGLAAADPTTVELTAASEVLTGGGS
jgi:N-acetylneuraminic acid mutarotase